jgi:hypothetical protein
VVPGSFSRNQMISLQDLLIESSGPTPVTFHVQLPDRTVHIAPAKRFCIDFRPEVVASIEGLLGQGSVKERYIPVMGGGSAPVESAVAV